MNLYPYPKIARIRKRPEFLRFFNQNEVKRLQNCILFRIQSEHPCARLGITVKARTNSVLRNRVKRQVREAFRLNRSKLKPFDYNVVVSGHHPVDYLTGKKVRQNLEQIWSHEVRF